MNKARLIITALRTENLTQPEAADRHGVPQSWVSKLVARFRDEGEAAFAAGNAMSLPAIALTIACTLSGRAARCA